MAASRSLTLKIVGDASGLERALGRVRSKVARFGADLSSAGRSLTAGITLPIAAVGGIAIKSAIDFESAFAGVRKTVDATEPEFARLETGFRDLAKQIPVSAIELSRIGEAAGQLGIQNENILGFTRVMADLGVTTNLSSDEAATALARLANITQMPQDQFDELGSVIVALGNKMATTESEIVEMGLRLAGAGKQIGLTEAETLSLAAALSSVGIAAEAGGSAFSRVMINMQLAATKGGKELDDFARVAGMSAAQFKQAFETDAAGALVSFITGLGGMQAKGQSTIGVLDAMGISEVRVRDALLRAAGAGDLFSKSLDIGNKAWKGNTALSKEASERYKTTASQLIRLKNQFMDIAITVGQALIPIVQSAIPIIQRIGEVVADLAEKFNNLSPTAKTVILVVAGIAAALGPILIVVGAIVSAFGVLVPVFAVVGGALAGLLLPALAVAAAAWLIYQNWDKIAKFVGPLVEDMVAFATGELDKIVSFVTENWPLISATITTVMDAIKAIFDYTWPVVRAVVTTTWDVIKTVISTTLGVILGTIKTIMQVIAGDWSGAWRSMKKIVSTIVSGILAIVDTLIEGVYDVGVNLVKALWRGIKSLAGWLKEKVLDWIKGVLPDVVKKALGISSPSRVFVEFGKQIVEGLAVGIEDTRRRIGDVVAGLTLAAVPSPITAAGGGLGSVTLTGPIYVNVPSGRVADFTAELRREVNSQVRSANILGRVRSGS